MRLGVGILFGLLVVCGWAVAIPSRPSSDTFLADYAGILSPQQKSSLSRQIQEQNERSSSHLFVVTVRQLKGYGQGDIGEVARAWFPAWDMAGGDVLLLLSLSERRARIQLGDFWGERWDLEAGRIMRDVIVPACEQQDYVRALSQGTQRLLVVTTLGPGGPLPAQNWYERAENLGSAAARRSGLSWQMCLLLAGSGAAMLLFSLLPLGTGSRIFAVALGVTMLIASVAAKSMLSVFWISLGLVVIWVAGTFIQAGFQSGASLSGAGGWRDRDDDGYQGNDSGSSSEGYGASSSQGSVQSVGDGGGATGSW